MAEEGEGLEVVDEIDWLIDRTSSGCEGTSPAFDKLRKKQ